MTGSLLPLLGTLCVCGVLPGCMSGQTYDSLVREADRIVEEKRRSVQADRDSRWKSSASQLQARAESRLEEKIRRELAANYSDLTELALTDALKIAASYNRECASEREGNISSALSYISRRHGFDPKLSGAVSYLYSWSKDTSEDTEGETRSLDGSLGVDRKTTFGTSMSLDVSASATPGDSSDSTLAASASLSQPLLKGAGRLVNRESLTQAERNLVYRLRRFELFRQDFAIRTTEKYYDLIRRKQVIENNRWRLGQADFLYRRAQALFKAGRVPEIDVFQAEQQWLQAENDARAAEEEYSDMVILFKTFLGVPGDVVLDVRAEERPEFSKVLVSVESAVRLAYLNRLDLATMKDKIEDAERAVDVARNSLLPNLSLSASAGTSTISGTFDDFADHDASVGITLTFPLDRLDSQVGRHSAAINRQRAVRDYALFRDNVVSEVRRLLRSLTLIEKSMTVQEKILTASKKRLIVAQTRFRLGQRPSRDVTDAQNELLEAQNRYIRFIVDHAVAGLKLERAAGILRVNPDGTVTPSVWRALQVGMAEEAQGGSPSEDFPAVHEEKLSP